MIRSDEAVARRRSAALRTRCTESNRIACSPEPSSDGERRQWLIREGSRAPRGDGRRLGLRC